VRQKAATVRSGQPVLCVLAGVLRTAPTAQKPQTYAHGPTVQTRGHGPTVLMRGQDPTVSTQTVLTQTVPTQAQPTAQPYWLGGASVRQDDGGP